MKAWRMRFQKMFFGKNMAKSLERLNQDLSKAMSGF